MPGGKRPRPGSIDASSIIVIDDDSPAKELPVRNITRFDNQSDQSRPCLPVEEVKASTCLVEQSVSVPIGNEKKRESPSAFVLDGALDVERMDRVSVVASTVPVSDHLNQNPVSRSENRHSQGRREPKQIGSK
jgi:hypothetical protein